MKAGYCACVCNSSSPSPASFCVLSVFVLNHLSTGSYAEHSLSTSHLLSSITNRLAYSAFCFPDTCFLCTWKRICIADICGCAPNKPKSSAPSSRRRSSGTITRTLPSTGILNCAASIPTKQPSTGTWTRVFISLSFDFNSIIDVFVIHLRSYDWRYKLIKDTECESKMDYLFICYLIRRYTVWDMGM